MIYFSGVSKNFNFQVFIQVLCLKYQYKLLAVGLTDARVQTGMESKLNLASSFYLSLEWVKYILYKDNNKK